MDILLAAVILGLIPALIANSKGRSFLLWWIYG
ncbi:zinc ribbon domain-containing protein, partial [Xenorhabdus sp. psl]|nr:zinc ribbon domain-containing protein [Xenorhabdus sp. psl]